MSSFIAKYNEDVLRDILHAIASRNSGIFKVRNLTQYFKGKYKGQKIIHYIPLLLNSNAISILHYKECRGYRKNVIYKRNFELDDVEYLLAKIGEDNEMSL